MFVTVAMYFADAGGTHGGGKNVISFRFVVFDECVQRDRQIRSLMFGYSVVKV